MKKTHSVYLIVILVFLMIIPLLALPKNVVGKEELMIKPSETRLYSNQQWVVNPTFDDPIEPIWYSSVQGDVSDVATSTGVNQGDITVIGDSRSKEVLLNTATQSNWAPFIRDASEVVPQRASVPYYGIDDDGAWCSHWWWEGESGGQPKNTPEMHWRTNVSMPVDMSDYNITSVSFNAVINASVDRNIDVLGDSTARWDPGIVSINQDEEFDSVQFSIYISNLDVDELSFYRIAINETYALGNDTTLFYDTEGMMGTYGDQAIIDAINNVLAVDPGHNNFTIILGIEIYCEDNYSGTDRDHWDDLRFKFLNLTFTYEKKIDKSTFGSWSQDLDAVVGSSVRIIDANIDFEYKMDNTWVEASEYSRFLIYINDREYDPNLRFINEYSSVFRDAMPGDSGFDITDRMLPYENFTLSIQVYIAENFELGNNITISIRNVYLYLSWTEIIEDQAEPFIFTALFIISLIGATVLAGYLIAYQTYLKYPVSVRKVRRYRKTLTNSKTPSVGIDSQKASFSKNYNSELKKTDKFM
ncbi:MAG: hypothetical protein ACFE96_03085, partial [Candidatus Hermodarchaeota archaeon]